MRLRENAAKSRVCPRRYNSCACVGFFYDYAFAALTSTMSFMIVWMCATCSSDRPQAFNACARNLTKGRRRTKIEKEARPKLRLAFIRQFNTLSGTPPQCARLGGYFFALSHFLPYISVFFPDCVDDGEDNFQVALGESAQAVIDFGDGAFLAVGLRFLVHLKKIVQRNAQEPRGLEGSVCGGDALPFYPKTNIRGIESDRSRQFLPSFSQKCKFRINFFPKIHDSTI